MAIIPARNMEEHPEIGGESAVVKIARSFVPECFPGIRDAMPVRVLLVEDNLDDARLIRMMFDETQLARFETTQVGRLSEACRALDGEVFDVILLDLALPDSIGRDTFTTMHAAAPSLPIIILSGMDDVELASSIVHGGAQDYLLKDRIDGELLARSVRYAMERTHAAHALANSERRFRILTTQAPVGIFETDAEGDCLYVNERWCLIGGQSAESALLQSWVASLHPEDRARILAEWSAATENGAEFSSDGRFQHPDGATAWVRIRSLPLRDEGGVIKGHIGTVADITERKRLEKEILEIGDAEQQRMGRELHDGVCQHLVATSFASRMLEHRLGDANPNDLVSARGVGDLIDEAIVQIRALSRGYSPIQLDDGLLPALRLLAENATRLFRIPCSVECAEPLPPGDPVASMHLYRIVQEATSNAMKHARSKCVAIRLERRDGALVVTVADDGAGFSSDKSSAGGGMGLHIMEYRAQSIGATMTIRPRAAGGTEVSCAFNWTAATPVASHG